MKGKGEAVVGAIDKLKVTGRAYFSAVVYQVHVIYSFSNVSH